MTRGCDANDGGDHYPIADGRYMFCGHCGETLRGKQFRKAAVPRSEAETAAAEDRNGDDITERDDG